MNITCGVDIIEINRIKEILDNDLSIKFKEKVFSTKEVEYCESKKGQKYQHYAARFAAKEAVFKAISKELDNKYSIEWKDICIENDTNGRPFVTLNNSVSNKIQSIDISISHCKEYAVANVIVIFKN